MSDKDNESLSLFYCYLNMRVFMDKFRWVTFTHNLKLKLKCKNGFMNVQIHQQRYQFLILNKEVIKKISE